MKILVIGGGGREHAIAWKVAQSPLLKKLYVAPGNAGTAQLANTENVPIAADDTLELVRFAQEHTIDLTLVGPEAPLALGLVNHMQQAGLPCLGPSQAAAQLEASKEFSKAFMQRHHIPTAHYAVFNESKPAIEYIQQQGAPLVIKADGLAAGKGVVIAHTEQEAIETAKDMLEDRRFGKASARIIVEAYLTGQEASFIALCDGTHYVALATSQDHKARDAGDQGPNTGGMGAYSPAPIITPSLNTRICKEVIEPVLAGMKAEGHPYVGFLYAGLMISDTQDINVLEFNCRLGDPETQPILVRLQSDLVELAQHALSGTLDHARLKWDTRPALGVVLAAGGYPGAYRKGDVISGLEHLNDPHTKVFHAGTQSVDGQIVTSGGRVLCVTSLGDTLQQAYDRAYHAIDAIHWPDMYYRSDIGHRALKR